jgi:general secretion pathway protein D
MIYNKQIKKLIFVFFVFTIALFGNKNERIELNIKDMEIRDFIKMVAKIDQKNILIPLNVRGKIDYISKKPILKRNVFGLLITILEEKGFTLIDTRKGFFMVERLSDASKQAPAIRDYGTNLIHTSIIPIKNIDAVKLSVQVKYLLSRSGKLIVSNETNSIIITDFPENIKIIRKLIKKLDFRTNFVTRFVELKHVKVNDIYSQIKNITNSMFDQKIDSDKISIFKNSATNSLIIVAKKSNIAIILEFIKKLDLPDKITKQNLHFVRLDNAGADEVAKILTQVISKKVYPKNHKKASVSVDKELNSLVLISSDDEFDEFMKLIEQLDSERKQVFVKARIMEISENKADEIGLKYGIESGLANGSGLYTLGSTLNGGAALAAPSLPISIPNLSKGLALGVSLSFLNQNGVANTLSEPSILCVNNKESTIYVGKTESILSQSTTGASTTDLTRNSYSREDIGLTMKIKPRISDDNKVILETETVLEDVDGASLVGLPTTTKREVKTSAVVQNGESVIIGGLIRNKINTTVSKIPLLGDIPLLGGLFRYTKENSDKINLVIILTPYIVNKSSELTKLREDLEKLSKIEKNVVKNLKLKNSSDKDSIDLKPKEDIDFDD